MKTSEEVSYILKRSYRRGPIDALDDKLSALSQQSHDFIMGQYSGTIHYIKELEWYRNGCVGERPKKEKPASYYLSRHLERQYKRIAKYYVRCY